MLKYKCILFKISSRPIAYILIFMIVVAMWCYRNFLLEQENAPAKFLFTSLDALVSRQLVYLRCCPVTFFSFLLSSKIGNTPHITKAFISLSLC